MSYKYKNMCTVQLKFSQENTVVTHEAIQKYIHIYTSILSTYDIYTMFKWMTYFLGNKHSSTEYFNCFFLPYYPRITAMLAIPLFHTLTCSLHDILQGLPILFKYLRSSQTLKLALWLFTLPTSQVSF
jgi:hypothetical protein